MLLIHEFRTNWATGTILSNDDVEFVRICLDVALSQAVQQGHTSTIYDMSPTVWACWLVQHVLATRSGGWQVRSAQQLLRWSFAYMYVFLKEMYARGDRSYIRDPATRQVIHRYRLPFKAMNVPPKPSDLFKWRRGARQLSEWMVAGGLPPLHTAIIEQRAPTIVPPPRLASRRADLAAALWQRIGQQSSRYQLQSVAQGGGAGDDDSDAEVTRRVVGGVMGESRAAAGGGGMSEAAAADMERELEGELEAQQQSEADEAPLEATAELIGPPLQQAGPQTLVEHIARLLEELQQQGADFTQGEPSSDGAGPSGSGLSVSS